MSQVEFGRVLVKVELRRIDLFSHVLDFYYLPIFIYLFFFRHFRYRKFLWSHDRPSFEPREVKATAALLAYVPVLWLALTDASSLESMNEFGTPLTGAAEAAFLAWIV